MADRGVQGAFLSASAARTDGAGVAVAIYANTSELVITRATTGSDILLFYVSATDQGSLDLNTIIEQCAQIHQNQIFRFKLGSERTRPSPGYMYANFVTGGALGQVNFGQIVETY